MLNTFSELTHQERVYQELKKRIIGGEFDASGKLPSLRSMVSTYQASAGSIRQALLKLESDHLISPQHGRGYYVSKSSKAVRILLVESGIHDHLFSEYVEAFQRLVYELPSGMLQIVSAEPCAKKELARPKELLERLDMHLESGVDVCFFDGEKAWGIEPSDFTALQQKTQLYFYNCGYPQL